MPSPNIHAMAAAQSAKAKQADREATVAWLASEAVAEAVYAKATVALEARLAAQAAAYNEAKETRARAGSARGARGAARRAARGVKKHARDADAISPECWIQDGMDPDGQWIGPVVVHGVHGYGAPPTWEQMQGLLSTPDPLSPYRDTPHWRLALQREEEKRQEDTAKRQEDIKKRIQKTLKDGGDP